MRLKKVSIALFVLTIALMVSSCGRGITPFQAANGKAKCGRWLK